MEALRQVRPSALVISWVVDIGGSTAFAMIFFVWLIIVGRLPQQLLSDEIALSRWLNTEPDLFAASLAGGLLFSVAAGYVAARIGGRVELLHGGLSSAACITTHFMSLGTPALALYPAWLVLVSFALAPAAGLLGAYLRLLQRRRLRLAG